jgi:hypothetical protein
MVMSRNGTGIVDRREGRELDIVIPPNGSAPERQPVQSAGIAQALLSVAPRSLLDLEAEILCFRGQYLLHWEEGGVDHHKLLSAAALQAAFSGQPVDSGWLPSGIVRCGEGTQGRFAVKWVPPGRHTLSVDWVLEAGEEGSRSARRQDLSVPLPGMVFLGVGGTYYVWASNEGSFNPASGVFAAPLPNVYPDGRVCWGSNVPPVASPAAMEDVWRLFIGSPFNADLSAGKSKQFPNDIRGMLARVAMQEESYPLGDLVQRSSYVERPTLGSVVDEAIAGGRER